MVIGLKKTILQSQKREKKTMSAPIQSISDDPAFDAQQSNIKKFNATASMKDKVRLNYIDFFDSITRYNKSISNAVDYGLTLKSIEVLFGAKYLNYREEMSKINPDGNLQSSGLSPTEIPYLDPTEITEIINYFFATHLQSPSSQAAINELIASIKLRRGQINDANMYSLVCTHFIIIDARTHARVHNMSFSKCRIQI